MSEEHAGHRQRMRERFRTQGLQGFAPHEVLELILFYAIPRRNVNPVAHRLLKHFGSLHAVLDATVDELAAVEGIGENAATLLHLFSDVARQLPLSREGERVSLKNRSMAQVHCLHLLNGLKQEQFYAVCLDAQMRVISDVLIAKGAINEVQANPRLVAQAVLTHNAHAVILCHNHPGGDEIPSHQDLTLTNQVGDMLAAMDVVLVDHIVVADGRTLSMAKCGLISFTRTDTGVLARVADPRGAVTIRNRIQQKLEKEPK